MKEPGHPVALENLKTYTSARKKRFFGNRFTQFKKRVKTSAIWAIHDRSANTPVPYIED